MPDTTLEEARRCPKCGMPGVERSAHKVPGGQVKVFICDNERCKWYEGAGWTVQLNADGTVPVRQPGEKEFDADPATIEAGRRYLEQTLQEEAEGEVRNPHG